MKYSDVFLPGRLPGSRSSLVGSGYEQNNMISDIWCKLSSNVQMKVFRRPTSSSLMAAANERETLRSRRDDRRKVKRVLT